MTTNPPVRWLPPEILDHTREDILWACNKYLAEQEFSEFCRQAWHVVEPGRPLVWGWHLQAQCEHLQAVYNHVVPLGIDSFVEGLPCISDLIINEPPRCSKSLFASVMFPAWVWTRWLGARFLNITYSDQLAERDALKCFNLVRSRWYQSMWPEVSIRETDPDTGDRKKTGVKRYDVGNQGGYRVSTTIGGMATGEGGDFRTLDDPHNVKKALSDIERNQANTFIDLTLPTRVVDPKRYATITVMQRLHQDDATGHQLEKNPDCDLLCFPMEYEAKAGNRCRSSLGFVDPRTEEGELLHPERWDRSAVEKLKKELRGEFGDFGVNSQLQQRPTPLGGGTFKPDNIILLPNIPPVHDLERIVRYWDKAATEGGGAFTAGALMAKHKSSGRTIILDVVSEQYATDRREAWILEISHHDVRRLNVPYNRYAVRLEQEGGSGGKDSALWSTRNLAGFNVLTVPKRTNKEADWLPIAGQVNAGGVEMVAGLWNKGMTQQMAAAPFGKYKDILDALAGGFKYLWLEGYVGVLG